MRLPKDLLTGLYKKPNIYLCETDKDRICQLEVIDLKASLKFNSLSELTFEVPSVYNNIVTGKTNVNPFYDKIEALRLIEVENFGYFELQGSEIVSDGIKESKSCEAYSLEYVLSQKYLDHFYVNTGEVDSLEVLNARDASHIVPIVLYDPSNPHISLLHLILEKVYGWKIGHVDRQLYTLSRQFEIDRESVYDFLMGEVCEKFNCYVVFNTYNNTINLYAESPTAKFIGDGKTNTFQIGSQYADEPLFSTVETVSVDGYKTTRWSYVINDNIGILYLEETPSENAMIEVVGVDSTWETDVLISFENLSQEVNVSYDADAIKTVLTVTYGDDYDIREANLGLPYLTDISYYYNVDWMGQDLYDAYTKYLQKSNDSQAEYTSNSKEILKINDKIAYEENRLSLSYTRVTGIDKTTVGTYYIRNENLDGSYYYTEVSLPSEYNVNENYYSNVSVNLNTDKVDNLYAALKNYFYGYYNKNSEKINDAILELNDLSDSFSFMSTYGMSYLINGLRNANSDGVVDGIVTNFLREMWKEIGRTPLNSLYLQQYKTIQEVNIKSGWSHKSSDNYGYYYPVVLFINSIEAEIAKRNEIIGSYEEEKKVFQLANQKISNNLLMVNNFTEKQLIRLNAFLREDELHIEDIVQTSLDNLSSSFKLKQDAMESGRIELKKLCQPQLQFSMNMANIYALQEFEPIINKFQLGNMIKIKLKDMKFEKIQLTGDGATKEFNVPVSYDEAKNISFSNFVYIDYKYNSQTGKLIFTKAPESGVKIDLILVKYYIKQSRLLQVDINFEDFSDFSVEFGELTSLRTQSDIHADLLSKAISAGKSVATNSSYWTKGSDKATQTDLKIQQGLLDATTQIKATNGEQGIIIDKYGIKLQKIDPETGDIDPHQTWMTNNMILMSDDGFKTSRSALGEILVDGEKYYGLIAEMVLSGYIEGSRIVGGTIQIGETSPGSGEYAFEVHDDGSVTMGGGSKIGNYTVTDIENAVESIEDINVPVASGIAPSDPKNGQLWIDTSRSPYVIRSCKIANGVVEWVDTGKEFESVIHTSKPSSYSKDDIWVLNDGEYCSYIQDNITYNYGPGSTLRSSVDSETFVSSHWSEIKSELTDMRDNVSQYFEFNQDNGLKIGQKDQKFYVTLESTKMSFWDNSNSSKPNQEVVSIGNQSAKIRHLTVEPETSFTCHSDATFNDTMTIHNTTTNSGFAWKIEANGSLSLVVV